MSTSTADAIAKRVDVNEATLTVLLADGRTITAPLTWFPRLVHATTTERANWQLIGTGEGIRWPELDEDINVQDLLLGRASGESQSSLQRWLRERQKIDDRAV